MVAQLFEAQGKECWRGPPWPPWTCAPQCNSSPASMLFRPRLILVSWRAAQDHSFRLKVCGGFSVTISQSGSLGSKSSGLLCGSAQLRWFFASSVDHIIHWRSAWLDFAPDTVKSCHSSTKQIRGRVLVWPEEKFPQLCANITSESLGWAVSCFHFHYFDQLNFFPMMGTSSQTNKFSLQLLLWAEILLFKIKKIVGYFAGAYPDYSYDFFFLRLLMPPSKPGGRSHFRLF